MKVEQALRLLPDLEALVPLRARVLASARADELRAWAGASPYLTVGRRELSPAELRRRNAQTFHLVTEHLAGLYDAYIDALDSLEHEDPAGAVSALLRAGRREEDTGRTAQALAWFGVALDLAAGLPDRRPEIQALLALAGNHCRAGQLDAGSRHAQRALALAEAEFDQAGAIAACRALGDAALERGEWVGARVWFERAMRLAEATGEPHRIAEIRFSLGELARRGADAAGAAEHLRAARDLFEQEGDGRRIAEVLNAQGLQAAAAGDHAAAAAAYREALAWARRADRDHRFLVEIRINLAALHLGADRLLEAETELRRAEELAIAGNLAGRLASIYVLLGTLHAHQHDETGFVFFEQAIVLARSVVASPRLEAEAYTAYGDFKRRLGQQEEAEAYLERAREIYRTAGLAPAAAPASRSIGTLTA